MEKKNLVGMTHFVAMDFNPLKIYNGKEKSRRDDPFCSPSGTGDFYNNGFQSVGYGVNKKMHPIGCIYIKM
jgi:hypothetical protein